MMERLTRPCEDTNDGEYIDYTAGTFMGIFPCCTLGKVVDRLAYYEDMEEQGRLVVLPAKQRSRVWLTEWWKNSFEWEKLSTPIERHIIYFSVEVGGVYAHFKEGSLHTKYFGKVAFLTREDAERALKEGAEHED